MEPRRVRKFPVLLVDSVCFFTVTSQSEAKSGYGREEGHFQAKYQNLIGRLESSGSELVGFDQTCFIFRVCMCLLGWVGLDWASATKSWPFKCDLSSSSMK